MMNHTTLFAGFDFREARLAFLMPPPEGGPRPAEAERINKEAVDPAFNVENADAATDREVGRATQEQLQAKTKLVESAMKSFTVGLREFKDSYAKRIKEATDGGDADLAAKLAAERDQRTEKIIADVNARLAELAATRGFPSYQITLRAGEPVLGPGPTGRVDVRQALRNVPEELRKRVMSMPPAEQEVFARVLAGKTQPEIESLAPSLANALKQVQSMNPLQVSAVINGLDNPGRTPEQLAKQFRLTPPQAQQVRAFFEGLSPEARDVLQRHLSACRDVIRSGDNGGTEIPPNSPARTAVIEAAIGEPALTARQVGLFRVALAEYLEVVGRPDATEADKQLEEAKLVIKGVNIKASNLDTTRLPLRIRTIKQSEMESAMLTGALMYLMAFVDQIGGKSKPLTRPNTTPQTNPERQKRLEEIDRNIKTREERLKVINAQLAGPPPPEEKVRKDLTEEKTRIEGELKSLRAEREKLQKEIAGTPENPNAKRIAEIDKTLKSNDETIKKLNAERTGPPVPGPDRVKAISEQITKLEKQNGELRAEREKLAKESGAPTPPTGPVEGPRLPHTAENRKTLNEATEKTRGEYDGAVASDTNKALILTANETAQAAANNELAHLQEYGDPEAVAPGRIAALQKSLAELRTNRPLQQGAKLQADVVAAEALPNTNPAERLTRLDAIINAQRARLAFAQSLPAAPAIDKVVGELSEQLQKLERERATLRPATAPEEIEKRSKDLQEATEKADKARTSLMATRGGPDRSGPAIIAAHDAAYAAVSAEVAHLSEFATPPARLAELRTLQTTIQRSKIAEISTHLRGESDRSAELPQTTNPERIARFDAMIRTNMAELNHLQSLQPPDVARIGALQKAIPGYRRDRAALAPV